MPCTAHGETEAQSHGSISPLLSQNPSLPLRFSTQGFPAYMKVRLHSATSLSLLMGAESIGKAERWPRAPVCKEMGCEFWQKLSVPGVLQRAPLPPEMQQMVPVSPGMLQRPPLPAGLTGVMLQNRVTAFQRSCEQTGQHMATRAESTGFRGCR